MKHSVVSGGMKYNLMPHTIIAGLILLIYLVSSFNFFTGMFTFIIPSLFSIKLTLIALMFCFKNNVSLAFRKNLMLNASLIAITQIALLYIAAFFTSLGISPYNLTPPGVLINTIYFSTVLLGKETSRTYLIKSCPKKGISMGMALIALLYTFISTPLAKFTTLKASIETVKFFGSDFLPTFAQNILATYLALLSGPAASLAYLGILEAFEWLSPILPNPPWAIKALITTLTPTIGFLMVTQTVSPFTLMRYGIISREEAIRRPRKTKKTLTIAILDGNSHNRTNPHMGLNWTTRVPAKHNCERKHETNNGCRRHSHNNPNNSRQN